MRSLVHRGISLHDHLGSARITLDNAARVIESQSYTAFGDHRTHVGSGARTSYIGREHDKETDLGFYGVRLYDPTYGRFLSVDPLWGKHLDFNPYHYVRQRPIGLVDFSGLDSAQRAEAVEMALAYIGSGSTYVFGSKGGPGRPVDCSGMVSDCVVAGGERDPNHGNAASGVLNIEANSQQVAIDDAEAGNIITFRNEKPRSYPYHVGIITAVQRDSDGNVESLTVVHSSSKANGPTTSVIDPRSANALGKGVRVGGVYKWDSKPDTSADRKVQSQVDPTIVNPALDPR